MITASQFRQIFPACKNPEAWAQAVTKAWARYGIESVNARAGFFGITGNESGGYARFSENPNYSAARLVEVFPRRVNGLAHAQALVAAGHEAIFNRIYSGEFIDLGNGDEASGDGWRFRGRGVVQLTGRANYRAAGRALGIDLEGNPDLALEPDTAALIAAWFMASYAKILPKLNADSEASFLEGAKKVGSPPDAAATQRRLAYRRTALSVLGAGQAGAPSRPLAPPPTNVIPLSQRGAGNWLERLIAALFGRKPT